MPASLKHPLSQKINIVNQALSGKALIAAGAHEYY